MYRSFFLLVLFAMCSVAGYSQKALESELMKREQGAWNAFGKGDSKYFEDLITDDGVIFSGSGFVNKQAAVAGIAARNCEFKSYSFNGFKVTSLNSTTALVTYNADQDKTCGGRAQPDKVAATTLYVKRNGKWMAAFHQESPLDSGEVILSVLGN